MRSKPITIGCALVVATAVVACHREAPGELRSDMEAARSGPATASGAGGAGARPTVDELFARRSLEESDELTMRRGDDEEVDIGTVVIEERHDLPTRVLFFRDEIECDELTAHEEDAILTADVRSRAPITASSAGARILEPVEWRFRMDDDARARPAHVETERIELTEVDRDSARGRVELDSPSPMPIRLDGEFSAIRCGA